MSLGQKLGPTIRQIKAAPDDDEKPAVYLGKGVGRDRDRPVRDRDPDGGDPAAPVKEHPILFSAPMITAILAGRKTQTRRLVRWAPREPGFDLLHSSVVAGHYGTGLPTSGWVLRSRGAGSCWNDRTQRQRCRYGVPGDRLWVREAWKKEGRRCSDDMHMLEEDHACSEHCDQTYVYYAATPREGLRAKPDRARITYLDDSTPLTDFYRKGWKPSIHMPRWASRIQLDVTDVRVQRLHEISEEDARAEGVDLAGGPRKGKDWASSARDAFATLWDSINADRMSWASNPWVWAVSFRRVAP